VKFHETPLSGLYLVELEALNDERGFFARSFCVQEFDRLGLESTVAQCNISFNAKKGTLRGLHFQTTPHEEAKLVRCTQGAIYDVAVDIRPDSPTYLEWFAVELTADNHRSIFIPHGFAHGFQTLADSSEVLYIMSEFFHPESARGLRWDDPAIGISWPLKNPIMSNKDRSYPLLERSIK